MCRFVAFALTSLASFAGLACPVAACLAAEPTGPRTLENLLNSGTSGPPAIAPKANSNDRQGGNAVDEVVAYPGNLTAYRGRVGDRLFFRVIGDTLGPLWGGVENTYTDDSQLAAAAVHAGVLTPGEEGVVEVRILPGQESYEGSRRNGVTSDAWQRYEGSYRIIGVRNGQQANASKILRDAVEEIRQRCTSLDEANERTLERAERLLKEQLEQLTRAGKLGDAAALREQLLTLRESILTTAGGSASARVTMKALPGKWNREEFPDDYHFFADGRCEARRKGTAKVTNVGRCQVLPSDEVEVRWQSGHVWHIRTAGNGWLAIRETLKDKPVGDGIRLHRTN